MNFLNYLVVTWRYLLIHVRGAYMDFVLGAEVINNMAAYVAIGCCLSPSCIVKIYNYARC